MLNIAVIRGGSNAEHEVSLNSGKTCIDALKNTANITDVIIFRDLKTWSVNSEQLSPVEALKKLQGSVDVALLMLHGKFGEDGTIQGALETAQVPYTGSETAASAIAINKFATNSVLENYRQFNIPKFILVQADQSPSDKDVSELGFPLVLKPYNGGSTINTHIVNDFSELQNMLNNSESITYILQQKITGIEVTCGVNDTNGEAKAYEIIEIIPPTDGVWDYDAKYTAGKSQEIIPARISDEITREIKRQSVEAHNLIGCKGITRSDFIIDQQNVAWFLEINTAPGMTATSLVPQEIQQAGENLSEVLLALCRQGKQK